LPIHTKETAFYPESFDAYKGQIADDEQQERGYDERQKWFGKEERANAAV
jgi:hypothetical protein